MDADQIFFLWCGFNCIKNIFDTDGHPFQSRFHATREAAMCCVGPGQLIHTYLHSKSMYVHTIPIHVCQRQSSTVRWCSQEKHNTLYVVPKSTVKIQPPWRQHSLLGPALDCDFVGPQLNCRAELKVLMITVYFRWLLTLFRTLSLKLRTDHWPAA